MFFCFGLSLVIPSTSAYGAITIKKNQIEGPIATFNLKRAGANQGGNVTKDNYVFLDCNRDHCSNNALVRVYNRKTCKKEKEMKWSGGRLSGLFAGWSNGTVTLVNMGGQKGCLHVKGNKSCATPPGLSYSAGGTSQGASYYYNNHTYKVAGYHEGHIAVRGSGGTTYYRVPKSSVGGRDLEPEGISIDHDTGDAYIAYDNDKTSKHPRQIQFWKIKAGVLKGTKKLKDSNPTICKANGSSSGGTTKPTTSGRALPTTPRPERQQAPEPDYDGTIETTLYGTLQDDSEGCGIFMILNLIVEILTWGIGILTLIGLLVSGIMYMSAKGDPERVIKAKRRIVEILIGVAMYATLWTLLNFLLPGGQFTISTQCEQAASKNISED